MIDIDRYAWTEERLGATEEFLARVIETTGDAIVIISSDARIALLNAAAEELLGMSRERAMGRPHGSLNLVQSDGSPMPIAASPATHVLRSGEPIHGVELLAMRPDGTRIVLSANASPLTDETGAVSGVVMSLRDATTRKEMEDSLRQQAAMLRAQAELLELAREAIFVRNASDGTIVYWNRGAEEIYAYRREDAVGRVSHELLATRFPQPLDQIEATMLRDGKWEGELIHQTRSGEKVVIESRWALQRDARGEPIAFLEINRDVTARKRAEEELTRHAEEIERRHREMAAVNASMAAISRTLELPEVLQNIVDAARELVQARYAALGVSDGRGHITQFITSGITPEERAAIGPLPQGHGLLGALIKDATPLRVPRIVGDPRSHGFPPNHPPMTSLLGVPIMSKGTAVGDLYLTDKIGADEFSEEDQKLLMILADHAAVAIENGQLYEDARAARDQLRSWNRNLEATVAQRTREMEEMSRALTARVLQAQEEERGRIARELHDETAQSLTRLLIDLDLIKLQLADDAQAEASIARFQQGLTRTLDEIRSLSHDLRPAILEDFGLVAAVRAYTDDWMQTFSVPVRLEASPDPPDRLPIETEIAVFRIAQEALMNAGKYAQAREVQVSLSWTEEQLDLTIRDDGAGFDLELLQKPTRQGGMGLYGMRERATLLGGSLEIETAPGQGTRITLQAPVS